MKKLFCALSLLGFAACGGNYSQASARDIATQHMCDYYQRCNQIGSGNNQTYATRDDCEVDQRAAWNNRWPVKDCDGKIKPSSLDTCTKAIDITDCSNGLDLLNTVFNKCSSSSVCNG